MGTVVYTSDTIVGNQPLISNGAYTTFTMHKSGSFPSTGYKIKSAKVSINLRNAQWDTITFYAGSTNVGSIEADGVSGTRTASLKTGYSWAKLTSFKITGGDAGTQLTSGSTVTITIEWAYITGTLTLSSNEVTAGDTVNASIGNYASAYSYKIKGVLGDAQAEWTPTASTMAITIPIEWCEAMPTSEVATATFTLTTYSGTTEMGTSTVTMLVNVPEWEIMPFPAFEVERVTEPVLGMQLVQGLSEIRIRANAVGTYGATISSFVMQVGSQQAMVQAVDGSAERTFTLTESGNILPLVWYIDSRGRVSETNRRSGILMVHPYSRPRIQGAAAERCDADGAEELDGEYINTHVDFTYSEIGTNTTTVKLEYQTFGASAWTTLLEGEHSTLDRYTAIGSGAFLRSNQYTLRYTVTDAAGESDSLEIMIPTGEIYMRLDMRNRRIGLGTYPVGPGKGIEIGDDWNLKVHGMEIVDLIDSRMVQPEPEAELTFGSIVINSPSTLASNTTQTYTGTITVPAGADVRITGCMLLYGSRIAFWGYPSVTVSGTTATFSISVRNDSSTATAVRCTIYYVY